MFETPLQTRSAPVRRAVIGAALVVIGVLAIAALVYISNSRAPEAERAMIGLGLAGSALASAVAQALIFLGGWMLWSARRRGSDDGSF